MQPTPIRAATMSTSAALHPVPPRVWLFAGLAVAIVSANALIVALYPSWQGAPAPDWPVAVDLLVLIPLLYLALNHRRGWPAVRRALLLAGFGMFIGGLIVPAESKQVWLLLDPLRYVAIALLLALQLLVVGGVLWRVFAARGARNVELALHGEIDARTPNATVARLLRLESRLWTYALLRRPVMQAFPGQRHFHVGRQGFNATNQLGFLVLVGAEIPIAHGLIALFDPAVAAVVSLLSVYGWLFLLADYRATLLRPISLDGGGLHLRYGVVTDAWLPWSQIAAVRPHRGDVRRARGECRLIGMGQANVCIELVPGATLDGLFGPRPTARIYLGVDEPGEFIAALQAPRG